MTRVSFYVLEQADADGRLLLACRLAEKAYRQGKHIYLHCPDEARCARLDDLLWSFRQGSFVPHARAGNGGPEAAESILLGGGVPPTAGRCDVLINLDEEIPKFFSQFERVAEIVAGDPETRSRARGRYQFYRDRGYPLETHTIETS